MLVRNSSGKLALNPQSNRFAGLTSRWQRLVSILSNPRTSLREARAYLGAMPRKIPALNAALAIHARTQWPGYLLALCLLMVLQQHYTVGLGASSSLPYHFFLIQKNAPALKGDLVAYRWHGGGPLATGATIVKFIGGSAGDVISVRDGMFYINTVEAGKAKPLGKKGQVLQQGPTGIIPTGQYYMYAPHIDSLDSRYALTGWINRDAMIGKVIWKW